MSNPSPKETSGILTNRLEFELDKIKFDQKFRIIIAEYPELKQRSAAMVDLTGKSAIRSVRYIRDRITMYLLLDRDKDYVEIKKVLEKHNPIKPVEEKRCGQVEEHIILDLLLIGLSGKQYSDEGGENIETKFSNLEGATYVFNKSYDDKPGDRLITLNLKIRPGDKDLKTFDGSKLTFNAETFAYVKMMQSCKRDIAALKHLQRYIHGEGFLKLCIGNGPGPEHEVVRHGYCGMKKKASIDFANTKNVSRFDRSKIGRVRLTLKRMMREYEDIGLMIKFKRTHLFDENVRELGKTTIEDFLKSTFQGKIINIAVLCEDPKAKIIAEGIAKDLDILFEIQTIISKDISKIYENLAIIQERKEDKNYRIYVDRIVQHLSIANFEKAYCKEESYEEYEECNNSKSVSTERKTLILGLLSNLVIKTDILQNKEMFHNWHSDLIDKKYNYSKLDRDWYFYDRVRIKNDENDPTLKKEAKFNDNMGCLKLSSNGHIEYSIIQKETILDDYHLNIIWNRFNKDNSKIKGVMSDGDNIFEFKDTDITLIPEYDLIRKQIRENELELKSKSMILSSDEKPKKKEISASGNIRTKENRNAMIKACTEIRYCHTSEGCYYSIGERADYAKANFHWGTNLHLIKRIEGFDEVPVSILDLMLALIVRVNRYTAIPYPFKYLREFESINGLSNYVPDEENES